MPTFQPQAWRAACEQMARDFDTLAALLHDVKTEADLIEIPPPGSGEGAYAEAQHRANGWHRMYRCVFERIDERAAAMVEQANAFNDAWRRRVAAFDRAVRTEN